MTWSDAEELGLLLIADDRIQMPFIWLYLLKDALQRYSNAMDKRMWELVIN